MIGRNTSSYEGPKILIKGEKNPKKQKTQRLF